jgi:hypothetical protein
VLDAGTAVELERLTLVTDTPGMRVEVKAGEAPDDFAETVASDRVAQRRTTFDLSLPGARRYYLIWITRLAGRYGHVNEVLAE